MSYEIDDMETADAREDYAADVRTTLAEFGF